MILGITGTRRGLTTVQNEALREPSDDTREALMTATWEATPAEIEALIKVLADLLERAP